MIPGELGRRRNDTMLRIDDPEIPPSAVREASAPNPMGLFDAGPRIECNADELLRGFRDRGIPKHAPGPLASLSAWPFDEVR